MKWRHGAAALAVARLVFIAISEVTRVREAALCDVSPVLEFTGSGGECASFRQLSAEICNLEYTARLSDTSRRHFSGAHGLVSTIGIFRFSISAKVL